MQMLFECWQDCAACFDGGESHAQAPPRRDGPRRRRLNSAPKTYGGDVSDPDSPTLPRPAALPHPAAAAAARREPATPRRSTADWLPPASPERADEAAALPRTPGRTPSRNAAEILLAQDHTGLRPPS
ncbi:hypothetical protein M885DRAFT_572505 [Pelagophyceae sp. CCMP2097]|nr:hypothetical protein M885DRAFT_572505 [Pelagophyceae sp. CCMP2097]